MKAKLDLKEHTDKGVYVHGLSAHRVAKIEVGCFVSRPQNESILYLYNDTVSSYVTTC